MTNSPELPKLLICKKQVENNIEAILRKTKATDVTFTPHFKTHQSKDIARIFHKSGIREIKVSSVEMAGLFAGNGWNNITVAFPFYRQMLPKAERLTTSCNLSLFVNSREIADFLSEQSDRPFTCYIEIDSGYGRSGVNWQNYKKIDDIIETLEAVEHLGFRGFYTHTGDSYNARSSSGIPTYHKRTEHAFAELKKRYEGCFPDLKLCSGDTPTASVVDDFGVINEISPGNLVYYDLMQHQIGSCSLADIAVAVAAPVVEINEDQNSMLVHGGAVHLSKDRLSDTQHGNGDIFGLPVPLSFNENEQCSGWNEPIPGAYVSKLSQEHGTVRMNSEQLGKFNPGDVVGILPVHSCLTANLMKGRERLI